MTEKNENAVLEINVIKITPLSTKVTVNKKTLSLKSVMRQRCLLPPDLFGFELEILEVEVIKSIGEKHYCRYLQATQFCAQKIHRRDWMQLLRLTSEFREVSRYKVNIQKFCISISEQQLIAKLNFFNSTLY